ncbi:hypothetical protein BTW26_03640 [Pediococcus acidilactici]|nr:hypothetical protein BTW26_03365 [Pediococcus acidilactici]APR28136.1 hypothetical protein BTW26_03640 [Pediococcus acidilactici]
MLLHCNTLIVLRKAHLTNYWSSGLFLYFKLFSEIIGVNKFFPTLENNDVISIKNRRTQFKRLLPPLALKLILLLMIILHPNTL